MTVLMFSVYFHIKDQVEQLKMFMTLHQKVNMDGATQQDT